MQSAKQYFAAKTKRSNTHMNYVTKQQLAALYIQNLLITERNIATRRLRSDSYGLRVCSHQDDNNRTVLTSKIVSYLFFFSQTYSHTQTKQKETKKVGKIGRGGGEETSCY